MTLLQLLHHEEQVEAARAEFHIVWLVIIRLEPHRNTFPEKVRAWNEYRESKVPIRKHQPPTP